VIGGGKCETPRGGWVVRMGARTFTGSVDVSSLLLEQILSCRHTSGQVSFFSFPLQTSVYTAYMQHFYVPI